MTSRQSPGEATSQLVVPLGVAAHSAVPRGLTVIGEGVSVDTPRGHEAEDTINDIIVLMDRLIHIVGQGR